ncbi:MAG TPA: DUF4835 family protein [Bacteroidota bacterium]
MTLATLSPAFGQELICEVTVNFERLSSAQQELLRNFESDVERYINGNKWTTEDFGEEKIRCAVNIVFQTGTDDGRYSAQVFIGSQRPVYIQNDPTDKASPVIRIIDENWQFAYLPNQRMSQDDFQFDPLTDFFDFYANLIIGLDVETYTELSGSRYFQKALNICSQGGSSPFATGWLQVTGSYSRFNIVDEIMNAKYQPFRFSFYSYHFDGIDLLYTDKQKGLDNLLQAIEAIGELRKKQDPRSILVKAFFDAKYQEIAEAFLLYPDRSVFQRIVSADPNHQSTYQEYSTR